MAVKGEIPWDMWGAILAGATLVIYVLWEPVRYFIRVRMLKNPCNAYLHIRELSKGELGYVVQDDDAHNVKELVLPANSMVDIEIAYYATVSFRVEETVYGFHGEIGIKPEIIEVLTPFVAKGEITLPASHWDRNEHLHAPSRLSGRAIGSCYTRGFKVRTKKAGVYKVFVGFLTDERDGEDSSLTVRIEDKPTTRMRCREHWGCFVKPLSKPE